MERALIDLILPFAPVHWGMAPQGSARPFVVLTRISGGMERAMDGASKPGPVRVQADIYAEDYPASRRLARRLTTDLDGRRTGPIAAIFVVSDQDLPAADAEGNGTSFRTSVDLMIHL